MMLLRCWLVTMLILAVPGAIEASGCRAVVRQKVAVVQTVAVAAVVTPVVATFVPVAVPVYGATYAPAYHQPAVAAPCTQSSDKLAAVLEQLHERLQRLERVQGVPMPPSMPKATDPTPPPAQPGVDRAAFLLAKNCAACHDAAAATVKGGKLSLTDGGKLAQISPETLGKIISQVSLGKMPKGAPMTPAERLELIGAITGE